MTTEPFTRSDAGRSAERASDRAARGRRASTARRRGGSLLRRLTAVIAVVAIVAVVRSLLFQTFVIPSGSMEDTLAQGDRVIVSLYDVESMERGDIIVFTDPDDWLGEVTEPTGVRGAIEGVLVTLHILPEDAGHHLIKRVIGLPGDRIVADGSGSLSVNGVAITEPYLKPGRSASTVAFDVTVPAGYVWVMGDNRSNSSDSRFHQSDAHGGFVPLTKVIGIAKFVAWPVSRWEGLDGGTEVFSSVPAPESVPTNAPTPSPAAQ